MLQPKRTKYRKQQKGKIKGIAHRGSQLALEASQSKPSMKAF